MSTYPSVTSVGGLLPTDLIDRVRAGDTSLEGTSPESYGLVPGERLNDQITRSWNRLRGVWESFVRQLEALPESERTATAITRDRWTRPLFEELGFAGLPVAKGLSIDGKDYPISHDWGGSVVVHQLGARVPIDRRTAGVAGAASTSPHGLVQEFLNRSETHLWGVVTNGLVLRVLRDNASLTRQSYVEFDLHGMFSGELFSDFVVLWLLCHRTRFEGDPPEKCLLERWSADAAVTGTRALDRLRAGVEHAVTALGEGFVAHRDNGALRAKLRSGEVTTEELQHQVLRIVYRLLFLLVAESRDLLRDPKADEAAVLRYRQYYSVHRLRELATVRRGTAHDDLWQGLQVTMRGLWRDGVPGLGLAPLGSFLWSPDAVATLDDARLDNRHLLNAIRALCFVRDDESRVDRAVDYRNLGAEELGSIYESLLELHAAVDVDAKTFALDTAAGNERKTTGSYYTPTSLISVLLDSALGPVLDEAVRKPNPEAALLALRVLDPAVGSGHFLIAAAHRIASRLASVRAGGGEPVPGELRHALREVIGHCLYGIDVNPMAVELCKVSLWMEGAEPGWPLSFLDHHIVCGNSLLGTTPALLEAGLPDEAFKPLEGDDKAWVSTLRRRNKQERENRNQGMFDFGSSIGADVQVLATELRSLDAVGDESLDKVAEKAERFGALQKSPELQRAKLHADAWCAAFVAHKTQHHPVITDAVVRTCGGAPEKVAADVRSAIDALVDQYRFLHLHVAFPDVFIVSSDPTEATSSQLGWNGGFDVVLGNPPWERVKLQEKEWFASRDPRIATAPNAAARKRLIAALVDEFPELHAAFLADSRKAEGESVLLRNSGRFPLAGRGDVNTYAVFAELMRGAISPTGRAGIIVPTGIATDDTTKHFFADLIDRASLASLFDFENRLAIFPGVHRSYKFSLLTMSGDARPVREAEFVFFALEVADLEDPEKRFTLSRADLWRLNPHTGSPPSFRSLRDVRIAKQIAARLEPLVASSGDAGDWGFRYKEVIHLSHDAGEFRAFDFPMPDDLLPVVEAKTVWLFDHRAADVELSETAVVRQGQSSAIDDQGHLDPCRIARQRFLVPREVVDRKLGGAWTRNWMLGFRDITSATNERTMIAAVVPYGGLANTLPMGIAADPASPLLAALLSTFAADWCCRQRLAGLHLTMNVLKNVPCPSPSQVANGLPSVPGGAGWLRSRVLELSFTAWDLLGFARDLGYNGPPFRWDRHRREQIRSELDAFAFRLYGLDRDDVDYVLDTFPIVKRKDEAAFGEYRTKRLILERYDAMAAAEAAEVEYESLLDPPPAHPSLAHDPATRPDWADWYLKG